MRSTTTFAHDVATSGRANIDNWATGEKHVSNIAKSDLRRTAEPWPPTWLQYLPVHYSTASYNICQTAVGKVKLIWILMKQVKMWWIELNHNKSLAPRSRHIATPALHHSAFHRPNALLDPTNSVKAVKASYSICRI